MSSMIKPNFQQVFEHSACNGFCICQECRICWLKPSEHSQAECMALQSFWKYFQSKETKQRAGIRACISSCWCSTCGACWSLINYHKDQPCPFNEQVKNMKATMAYMGDKEKRTLDDMSIISEEPLELDPDEPSSSRLEPKLSHHSATKPTSPPGLDRTSNPRDSTLQVRQHHPNAPQVQFGPSRRPQSYHLYTQITHTICQSIPSEQTKPVP